jgi:hypothetical protein
MSEHDLRISQDSGETFGYFRSQSTLGFEDDCDSCKRSYEDEYDVEEQTLSSSVSMPSLSHHFSRHSLSLSEHNPNISSESDDDTPLSSSPENSLWNKSDMQTMHQLGNTFLRNPLSSSSISSMGTLSKLPRTKKRKYNRLPMLNSQQALLPPSVCSSRISISSKCLFRFMKCLVFIWIANFLLIIILHNYNGNVGSPILSPYFQIPLPPPDHKVSVVLMNYSRPRMIKESPGLMPTLLKHPSIDEVILLHANPKTAFKYIHPKVVNVDATKENSKLGLSVRFYFCQLAKNDWVIHVDDDMEFTDKTLNEMLTEFGKNTHRIVGKFGKNRKENSFFNGYSSMSTRKESDIILTKFMVMERDICSAFFNYSHLIWEDVVLNNGDGPLWNGADIFMSLVANRVYGREKNNYAMDWLDVRNAPDTLTDYKTGSLGISGGFKGLRIWDYYWWLSLFARNRHYSYKGSLWRIAKERLAVAADYPIPSSISKSIISRVSKQ